MEHTGQLATEFNRRRLLQGSAVGLGSIALNWMLSKHACAELHHPPRAKSIIWLFMEGGPSHLDLVDPKPLLNQLAGKPLPGSFREPITAMGERGSPLLASPRKWTRYGESGLAASDWIPHIGSCMDDIAVIRSCWTNGINHAGGVCQMNTCINFAGRPSLGSWIHYGLGSANDNLPAFVVMCDNAGRPVNGPRNWGSGFMPASHQGVRINGTDKEPIRNLNFPEGKAVSEVQSKLQLLNEFNQSYASRYPQQSELEARIRSYELAFRMQAQAPEALDMAEESASTLALYGIDQKSTEVYGRNCLLARRLVERGVRFVQLFHGTGSKWDSHAGIKRIIRLCVSRWTGQLQVC